MKPQAWVLRLGNTWLRYNIHVGWSQGRSSTSPNLVSLHSLQHPAWSIPQLPLGSLFYPFCQEGVGRTLPPSWVQGLRRISGPGFEWIGLQGSLGLLAAGQGLCSAGWCGASSLLLLGQTLFPTSDFSPLSPKRIIGEHFSKVSPRPVVPSTFHAGRAGMSGPLRSLLPKDVSFPPQTPLICPDAS